MPSPFYKEHNDNNDDNDDKPLAGIFLSYHTQIVVRCFHYGFGTSVDVFRRYSVLGLSR